MREPINLDGLPSWAQNLLVENLSRVRQCQELGGSFEYVLESPPNIGLPEDFQSATIRNRPSAALQLRAFFLSRYGRVEYRWIQVGNSWEKEGDSSPDPPEIQMDAGIPMGEMSMTSKDPQNSVTIMGIDMANGPDYTGVAIANNYVGQSAQQQSFQQYANQSGLANIGNAYGRELRGDGWMGPSIGDLLEGFSSSAARIFQAKSRQPQPPKPAAPEPPEIKSPNGRMIILKNPEDED